MDKKTRIKFYCRSFDKELYEISRKLYASAGYPCVRLTDKTADGYFFAMLQDKECDIAINVDEDCFISDLDAVLALADKAWEEGWVNIGCSDAGKGVPRGGDAEVTNPFFNVFNLTAIREKWNSGLIKNLSKGNLKTLEPYYNFFHWTVKAFPGKTLYLDNERHSDGLSTILYDTEGHHLCSHSWFARQFHPSIFTKIFEGNDVKTVDHAKRIAFLISEVYAERGLTAPHFSLMQKLSFKLDTVLRWCIKVPQRVVRWPKKVFNTRK